MNKGILIVIEGLDGTGKSTIVTLLRKALSSSGNKVITVREPGGTPLGAEIRKILLNLELNIKLDFVSELFLFMADRSALYSNVIKPEMERGGFVISDRSGLSTMAYQGYGRQIGQPKSVEIIYANQELATHGIIPDLLVVLDCDDEIALKRLNPEFKNDRFESEQREFRQRTRRGYQLEYDKIAWGKRRLWLDVSNLKALEVTTLILVELRKILCLPDPA